MLLCAFLHHSYKSHLPLFALITLVSSRTDLLCVFLKQSCHCYVQTLFLYSIFPDIRQNLPFFLSTFNSPFSLIHWLCTGVT